MVKPLCETVQQNLVKPKIRTDGLPVLLLGIKSGKLSAHIHLETCPGMFIIALFFIAGIQK